MGFQLPTSTGDRRSSEPSTVCGGDSFVSFFKSSPCYWKQLERRAWTPLKENTTTAAVKATNAVKVHVVRAKSHVSLRQNWKKFNDTEFRQLDSSLITKPFDFSNQVG